MSPAYSRWLLTLGFLMLAWLGFAQAGGTQLGNSRQIEDAFIKGGVKGKLADLMPNRDKKKEKDFPVDILDTAAKYYVYGVTWASNLDASKPADGGSEKIMKHVMEFDQHINKQVLPSKANDPAFANAYSSVLVARFKELTDLPVVENGRALVYGTQLMLPLLAKLQTDEINSYLLQLLDPKSAKHDLIKLGAIKGLREFMPVDGWGDANTDPILLADNIKKARKKADLERVEALTQFILRPPPAMANPEELEAYRFLRREAIEALGEARAPAVAAFVRKKQGEVEGPIAPVLLRVLIPGAMMPETNLQERNAAALGLCKMKSFDLYEPGPTYYFINKTFFDLATDFSVDFTNIQEGDKRKLPTTFPWKHTSKSWEAGLKNLIATADKADKEKAKTIERNAHEILLRMFDHKQNINANIVAPDPQMAPGPEFLLFKDAITSAPLKWDAAK